MSGKISPTNGTDGDGIDTALLEKRLEGLRDTQESVQGLSLWCQANKRHSQAIVDTWLQILRKSPVEKRLTMFYLANDVVQHAKRKADLTVVNQWAFAVQKATPHVRSPSSVSNAIARIFKIWEERGIYSKDAVADLLSLLNNVSSKEKTEKKKPETYTANAEKVAAFQPSQLISKIKLAYRLKSHLGTTFRTKSYCQMDMETLKNSIKDRQHGQDVIQEMGTLVEHLRTSEMKLQAEVEERRKVVETGEIAIVFYENVRSESKIVNAAYKNFTNRVLKAYDAVDNKLRSFEEMEKEPSPCPSPPTAAPSPVDDDDYEPSTHPSNPIEVLNPTMETSQIPVPNTSISRDVPYMGPTTPTVPFPSVQSPVMPSYTLPPSAGGSYDTTDFQQQLQSWTTPNDNFSSMMNFPPQSPMPTQPPPSFSLTPAMRLQMSMQQQSLQQAYFSNKFDQNDVGSIPLPPPNPPSNPPLPPPPESMPHFPPLPPQPHNPPPPDMPVYTPQSNSQLSHDNVQTYPNESTESGENLYVPRNPYQLSENMYQSQSIRDLGDEYVPSEIPFGSSNMPQGENPFQTKHRSPPYLSHGNQQLEDQHQHNEYQPSSLQSRISVPENSSHFDSSRDTSSQSPDLDFDSDMNNAHSQQSYDPMKHQYTPKNYHPYNPAPRTRRTNSRAPGPRNFQPLGSPNPSPRFQSRNPISPARPQGEMFNTSNKIPSLLGSTTSPAKVNSPPFRTNQHTFEGYKSFDDFEPNSNMLGANGGGSESSFQFDNFQSQNPFEDNGGPAINVNQSIRPRGMSRGFRGGFRGSPRGMRGNGPRRGRF